MEFACDLENGVQSGLIESSTQALQELQDSHPIWNNPLLIASSEGQLTLEDFRFIFSQYYFYSRNFTKLLAAAMIHCDSDYHRSMLSKNLWEEGGGLEVELRHAEIFRRFLTDSLAISIEHIVFESYSELFFKEYLNFCLNSDPIKVLAALSFGTEGIISRLYLQFVQGMKSLGFSQESLTFFNIHMACDDEHAITLKEMVLFYQDEPDWLGRCKSGIQYVMDLRNTFFTNIYNTIQSRRLHSILENISSPQLPEVKNISELKTSIEMTSNRLYHNEDLEKNIKFTVDRVPFKAEILDPRIVHIPAGFHNEFHSHAHETVFLILAGNGEVVIDEATVLVRAGDLVFVPRWSIHQTRNTGDIELKYFAVTDYGLTKRLPENSEEIYRQNVKNVSV